ncbi:hypothetical protein EDB81DRAFT_47237 [Dactylonectria macrodidyma]|uniref:Uncharacterized protein n=1 Tax=Dactylonectria macrodidyma TaxID=307937 RepID=A0A9P9FST5_9HYPO|nr:hypothetical protein EDB81DRAFT_47237 [Dactylonectria macrodidyma]
MSPSAHLRALCVSKAATSALIIGAVVAATASCISALQSLLQSLPNPCPSFSCFSTPDTTATAMPCGSLSGLLVPRVCDGCTIDEYKQTDGFLVLGCFLCNADLDTPSKRLHFGAWLLGCHFSDA